MDELSVTRQTADKIRSLRVQRGWSAQRLADECAAIDADSMTRSTVAKIEAGLRKGITVYELAVLATALGVPPAEMLDKTPVHLDAAASSAAIAYSTMPPGSTEHLPVTWSTDSLVYRVLGELQVKNDVGRPLELPGGIPLILLAALLLNVNQRISKPDLIRAAWGADAVDEAQLYKRMRGIRDLFRQAGRPGSLKTHTRFGYELQAAEDEVDFLVFLRLVREAEQAGLNGRSEDETGCLRRALALWRGPHPLSNVPTDAFCAETEKLEQRYRRAAGRLFDLEFAAGQYERILDEVIQVAGFYPGDRRLCELLMLTVRRCGHLFDAHRAYERYERALAQEAGSVPDAALRDLNYAIALGDQEVIAEAEATVARRVGAAMPARGPVMTTPRQLPSAPILVGRDGLVAEATWLLSHKPAAHAPVLVISGPGGVGKTALALRAAAQVSDRYPDGQLYLELRGNTGGSIDTTEILAQFLRAFGVSQIPESTSERLAAYRTLLAGRRVLIVLDDVVDGAQVNDLVPADPACSLLVTARRRLPEIANSHHMASLERLDDTAAVELFLQVMKQAGIAPDEDLEAVGQVVRLCDGLPLALRIAGALRVHDHPRPTKDLVARLARQGLDGLAYGELNVARSIGAGFDRLDAVAQRLFLRLGLLPLANFGPWTAAALLEGYEADSDAALSALAARFLIEPVTPGPRYRFHDLTRQYARQRALADHPGDAEAIPAQAYRALLTLTRRAHAALYGGDYEVVHSDEPDWEVPAEMLADLSTDPLDWFEGERNNIRAAVEHTADLGLTTICWDLAISAHEFYTVRGYFDDWQATHTVALKACRVAGDRRGEGVVLTCLNQPALVRSGRSSELSGVAGLRRALDLLASCGEQHGRAIALRTLANTMYRQGRLYRSLALFQEALVLYEASNDTAGRWQTIRFIGQNLLDLGEYRQARQALAQAESIAEQIESQLPIAQTRYWTGQACLAIGDLDGAQAAFEAVLAGYGEGSGVGEAYARHGIGAVAVRRGAYAEAERNLQAAVSLARQGKDAILEGRVRLSIAALREAQNRPGDQIVMLEQAAHTFAEYRAAFHEIQALIILAGVMNTQGRGAAVSEIELRIRSLYEDLDLPDKDKPYYHGIL